MFRKLYNRAVIEGLIQPDGPVLIVEGGTALDPTAPDLGFVRTVRAGQPTVYLPGSSLKGVLRAHAERILTTEIGAGAAEDPFNFHAPNRKEARSHRKRRQPDRPAVFRISGEADRLFGSTEIAGRFRVADALPPDEEAAAAANRTEVRHGIGIDRAKQSVRGKALFEQEAVTGGSFAFQAVLENFELWMLALILQVLRDLDDGFVQIGHAKTRGFGTVRLAEPAVRLLWPGRRPKRIEGAGARERNEKVRKQYGLHGDDVVDLVPGFEEEGAGMFSGYRYGGWDHVGAVLDALAAGPWRTHTERAKSNGGHDAG